MSHLYQLEILYDEGTYWRKDGATYNVRSLAAVRAHVNNVFADHLEAHGRGHTTHRAEACRAVDARTGQPIYELHGHAQLAMFDQAGA